MGDEDRAANVAANAAVTQVAIDGAAGVGKSTVGELVAGRIGALYIDSGAFYRALTLLALRRGVATDDEDALLALIAAEPMRITRPTVADGRQYSVFAGVDPEDLAPNLHRLDVTRNVSTVARFPRVRAALIDRMRAMADEHSVVMVGRDIGKVVLPHATLKIALTLPADERARRRHTDLVAALGDDAPALPQVLEDIEARDHNDAAQMDLASDAIEVENRDGRIDETVSRITALLDTARGAGAATPGTPVAEPEAGAALATVAAPETPVAAPASRRPAAREGAYVAPKVTAPRGETRWDGTASRGGYVFIRFLALQIMRLFLKLKIEGLENLPREGGVMLASNHAAWIDIPALGVRVPRPTHYMAKIELFQTPVLGGIIGMMGAFPVRRGEGDRESLRTAERLLNAGEIVSIFPEGHRSDGQLIRGMPGVALIALRANAPVVPAAIINSRQVFKKGHILFRRPTVIVRYGKPFKLATSGARHSKADLERGADEIMTQIARLLPPEYRGVYADQVGAGGAAQQPAALTTPTTPSR